ncbi:riboflavin synthase [Marinilongibacter aquaticus]|uniref:riboflavin synthase n=1 Tax=Marinilongibacter aquaticus TaxID=2975157 RepID=UPI0021BD1754|nr:riboflavin synthase [Marinilongibacter aquaticus]UBM58886.1 riboflavin synthase [Marinilongibacter aquaticus]
MFTGIVESQAQVLDIVKKGTNKTFKLESPLASELKIDQSVSHNGVCLTVEKAEGKNYEVTAILETLEKTNLDKVEIGATINLERCMPANGRFDGHIVQGHVDQIGLLESIENFDGSYLLTFSYDSNLGHMTVEKGSICVNGISLTVVNSQADRFSVAIIPYTWAHTNLHALEIGQSVNLEFDIIGKYMQKIMQAHTK